MDNFGEQRCRLCFSAISDEHFKEMKDITKSISEALLKLNLANSGKYVMCSNCSRWVMEAYRFKSMCLHTNSTIISYIDDKTECPIDLKVIYMKEAVKKCLVSILDNHKVCRFCMQLVKDTGVPAHELAADMIEIYIPEINLTVIRDPVICKDCFDSFIINSNFIKNCLEVNKQIKNDTFADDSIPRPTVHSCIKIEEIDIKSEYEQADERFETDSIAAKSVYEGILNNLNYRDVKVEQEDEKRSVEIYEDNYNVQRCRCDPQLFECETCGYKTKRKGGLKKHHLTHTDVPLTQLFKCGTCKYQTKRKDHLERHVLMHKEFPDTEGFQCEVCAYRTKRKDLLRRHLTTHKNTEAFECHACDYSTRYEKCFRKHQLTHEDASNSKPFECHTCDFKTKYKKSLKQHELMHQDSSLTELFECYACDYKTRRKGNLKVHQLKHVLKTEVFQCDTCDYQTKIKYYLTQHQLTHKDDSEREMFVCDSCDFTTKYKKNIKRHKLIHNDVSETVVLECDTCDFKTKRKDHLRDHVLAHRGVCEKEMFECYACDFKSKYKNSLKKHYMTHKDVSETDVLECHVCGRKFKQKHNLRMHVRRKHPELNFE